jgi:hypothetical protein
MMNKVMGIVNTALRTEFSDVVKNGSNFRKGDIGGYSIEYDEGTGESSFIYYSNEKARDSDFNLIIETIQNNGH